MISKSLTVFLTAMLLINVSAKANSLIDNQAVAFVDGHIIQDAKSGSDNEVNVGSIIVHNGASATNIKTKVFVAEDIIVKSAGKDVKVNIGTVEVGQ